ncbi:MAG: sialate O-acetylesterase, partial [Verrucomicrobiales bacterium]|nr:sialate O-acetylesterase [Verrucomicrobiales bacterium]
MKPTATLLALAALISPAAAKPLPVYILSGQSNMQGHAHVRTLDVMALDPRTAPLLKKMRDRDGAPTVCKDIYISSIGSSDNERSGQLTAGYGADQNGSKIGPEFSFGITLQEHLDGPALIIKTAWGGKSIHTDFRPPSAGPYEFRPDQIEKFQA